MNYTLDYDLLEVEVMGTAHGKCNDTFKHQPPLNFTAEFTAAQARAPTDEVSDELIMSDEVITPCAPPPASSSVGC